MAENRGYMQRYAMLFGTQMISSNVFWGSILAFPTALFVMRRKKDDAPAE